MTHYDTIIIGGGPAGMSAALHLQKLGRKPLIIASLVGGQLLNTEFLVNLIGYTGESSPTLALNMYKQLQEEGVDIEQGVVNKIEKNLDDSFSVYTEYGGSYNGLSVLIATGSNPRKLEGLLIDDSYVSYCASCDGFFHKGKVTAVVGGGDTALEDALTLSGYCKEVHLIHRRNEFRGSKLLQDSINNTPNIIVHTPEEVSSLQEKEEMDNRTAILKLKSGEILEVSGLFVAIGQIPNTSFLEGLSDVELDEEGFIEKPSQNKGLFIAGDAVSGNVRQVSVAIGDGGTQAIKINEYLMANI